MAIEASGASEARDRANDPPKIFSCVWCERIHEADHPLSVCSSCRTRLSTMRSLGMSGSYPLDDDAIDRVMVRRSPGNYALGYMDGNEFVVFYVGRSDSDVKGRLHAWVGMPSPNERYASPARAPWDVQLRDRTHASAPCLGPVASGDSSYTRFAYSYAASSQAAFEKEWRNYDDFGGRAALDNPAQPAA